MNIHAVRAIYRFEMARTWRTLMQSIISPVISTSLYFIVFGAAIGSRMKAVDGVTYGAFIVPGLIMLSILTESISNGSFGIYMPKWSGTIYEMLSAPVSALEVVLGYVGAAASKSVMLGTIILITARLFVLREAATRAAADRHAADLSRRQLLFHRHAAAVLAEGGAGQPGGLSGQRVSLELLRHGRRGRGPEPRHDDGISCDVARHRRVDLQDRLQAQGLNRQYVHAYRIADARRLDSGPALRFPSDRANVLMTKAHPSESRGRKASGLQPEQGNDSGVANR